MRVLYWAAVALAALVAALFALANRATVTLALWPLPFHLELPLYLLVVVTAISGVLFGALTAWVAGRHWRRKARRRGRRVAALERELAATQAHLPGTGLPAPPHEPRRG